MSKLMRALEYGKSYGGKKLVRKALEHGIRVQAEAGYECWLSAHLPSKEELDRQEKKSKDSKVKFSVLVPIYRTPEVFLREMIESVKNQSYRNWELCIADGSGDDDRAGMIAQEYAAKDPRIRYRLLEANEGISGNTNQALKMAEGDYICLLDHDDLMTPDALYHLNKMIQSEQADMVYSDEDKVNSDGTAYFQPHFKSDFNLGLLRSNNYICHLFCVRRETALEVGGFSSEYDGAQDYDFILKCAERSEHISHVPRILYHWRCHEESTAANPESKRYAYDAGRRAVEDHLVRCGIPAVVKETDNPGFYRTRYKMKEFPKVTILVRGDFTAADSSWQKERLLAVTEYPNMEVRCGAAASIAVRRVFSGVSEEDEWILFLDKDCYPVHRGWLRELMSHTVQKDAGCITGRIYNERKELLYAGEALGIHGMAAACPFAGYPLGYNGYMHKIGLNQDCTAVTEKCMLVHAGALAGAGCSGIYPGWEVELGLKLRMKGLRNIYTPYAVLEYKGAEDEMPSLAEFAEAHMEEAWAQKLGEADPYYHPELSARKGKWRLK